MRIVSQLEKDRTSLRNQLILFTAVFQLYSTQLSFQLFRTFYNCALQSSKTKM